MLGEPALRPQVKQRETVASDGSGRLLGKRRGIRASSEATGAGEVRAM